MLLFHAQGNFFFVMTNMALWYRGLGNVNYYELNDTCNYRGD